MPPDPELWEGEPANPGSCAILAMSSAKPHSQAAHRQVRSPLPLALYPALLRDVNTVDPSRYTAELAKWRIERDEFFVGHYATPLSDDAIERFTGIRYFDQDPRLVFETLLESADIRIAIESSTGNTSEYPTAGTVCVPFVGGTVELHVLRGEDDDLFIPFRDATSGDTSYSGGRYVAVQRGDGDAVTIDFNKAINPYCAYDPDFSCPLPPAENRLSFSVAAGEMDYR